MLTNNPIYTPRDLSARLGRSGIDVPEDRIWTSALATADFVSRTMPRGSAYVIGEAGLTTALHEAGFILSDIKPDYVILGETRTYSFESITTAIRLILGGARFICTNPDATGPSENGVLPAAGAVAALVAMIGDRMDTDVVAGVEAGLNTFLVLTGITTRSEVETFPYRPDQVVNSIQDLIDIAESGVVEF